MDENENNWSDSWALLALFAMVANMSKSDTPEEQSTIHFNETRWHTVDIDKFTIEQLRAAAMNKKEAEKLRLDILRDAAREEEPDDYRGLYGRSWDV